MASKNSIIAAGADGWMFRNRIINGDFRIDQRYEGTTVLSATAGNTYTLDRWIVGQSTASTLYGFQSSTAYYKSIGFNNALIVAGTNTSRTVAAGDVFNVFQQIEGINVADLAWGTVNGKPVTLSFWFTTPIAGTYCCSLNSNSGSSTNYSYVIPFVAQSNNPTLYTFTVLPPPVVSGVWQVTPASTGIQVRFDFGSGTTFQTSTTNAWTSGTYVSTPGCVNITTGIQSGQNIFVTGVQLEVGTIATPFEVRPYEVELVRCQRYFEKSYDRGTKPGSSSNNVGSSWNYITLPSTVASGAIFGKEISYKVQKMIGPSIVGYSANTGNSGVVYDQANNADVTINLNIVGINGFQWYGKIAASNQTVALYCQWTASAEL